MSSESVAATAAAIERELDEAIERAEAEPFPPVDEAQTHVYAEG